MNLKGSSFDQRPITSFKADGTKGQTLDQLCMYDIMIPNIRYKQQLEREAYFEERGDLDSFMKKHSNQAAIMATNKNQIYSIKSKMSQEQYVR